MDQRGRWRKGQRCGDGMTGRCVLLGAVGRVCSPASRERAVLRARSVVRRSSLHATRRCVRPLFVSWWCGERRVAGVGRLRLGCLVRSCDVALMGAPDGRGIGLSVCEACLPIVPVDSLGGGGMCDVGAAEARLVDCGARVSTWDFPSAIPHQGNVEKAAAVQRHSPGNAFADTR